MTKRDTLSQHLSFVALASLLLVGCDSSSNSTDVPTPGIRADYSLTSIGPNSLRAEALFIDTVTSGNQSISLDGADTAQLLLPDGTSQPLTAEENGYTLTSDSAVESGNYAFELRRDGLSALNSTVFLPASVALSAPAAGTSVDHNNPIEIRWNSDQNTDAASMAISLECGDANFEDTVTIDDDGTLDYDVATFLANRVDFSATNCDTIITIERRLNGTTDSLLHNQSTLQAIQSGRVSVTLI